MTVSNLRRTIGMMEMLGVASSLLLVFIVWPQKDEVRAISQEAGLLALLSGLLALIWHILLAWTGYHLFRWSRPMRLESLSLIIFWFAWLGTETHHFVAPFAAPQSAELGDLLTWYLLIAMPWLALVEILLPPWSASDH